MPEYRRPRKRKRNPQIPIIAILSLILVGLIVLAIVLPGDPPANPGNENPPSSSTDIPDPPTPPSPPEVKIVKESLATFSATGDMLMHMPVVNTGYDSATGKYNFDSIFRYFSDYVKAADFAVGNLETTLAGPDFVGYDSNGKQFVGYHGYPSFNCPDEIITGMKDAGFDSILTANNHTYDTRTAGFRRTIETIRNQQLGTLGTKADAEEPNYVVAERNGIRIGLSCYTYEDDPRPDKKAPNSHLMTDEDAALINAFDYDNLDLFYAEIEENLSLMEQDGADAYILFVHWGNEYQTAPNDRQKAMAQKLCDLGVDVIIGGHPHVIQPVELLTSTLDETQKTVCLYSLGNAVSNQRLGNISSIATAHTEDGMLFSVSFAKYSDGTVILEKAELIPTWVNLGTNPLSNRREYNILPLDTQIEDWKTQFHLTDYTLSLAQASYERTMALVGEGMTAVNTYLQANQAAVEQTLGVE